MFSKISPPHWCSEEYPFIDYFLKAWRIGDQNCITSQCGQSEFVYLLCKEMLKNSHKFFTYIDIGANDGVTASSTYFLAINGWRGICVEPHAEFAQSISSRAHNSFCITAALGQNPGILDLQTSNDKKVLSTLEDTSEQHQERLRKESNGHIFSIPTSIIDQQTLFDYYFRKFSHLEFYKIDCEGHELTALEYLDDLLPSQRPKFIEYENNYRKNDVSKLLRKNNYHPLIVFDAFAEIWYDKVSFNDHNLITKLSIRALDKISNLGQVD